MKTSALLMLAILAGSACPMSAQKPASPAKPAVATKADTAQDDSDDDETGGRTFLFGVAGGALSYDAGRSEQALGVVLRWLPVRWFSLSTTPTTVRAREIASSALPATSRSGLTDIPVEATVSQGFSRMPWSPSVALTLGATLPVGDTASGLGSGEVGYSASGGVGFSPAERIWVHIGAGRSLTRFSVQSAFSSGTGWGDASIGTNLTDRLGASVGFSTDLGAVDSSLARSTSLEGGMSVGLGRAGTLNVTGSHGVSGTAPQWSIAIGVGTAFPYLNHLGGSSPNSTLQDSFGGGTHGLSNGKGNAGGNATAAANRGRGKKP
jgi:hypothetical protein